MKNHKLFTVLLLTLAALFGAQGMLAAKKSSRSMNQEVRFKVRIDNISGADGFMASNGARWPFAVSPGVYAIYSKNHPVFTIGRKAMNSLEAQAEDGNPM